MNGKTYLHKLQYLDRQNKRKNRNLLIMFVSVVLMICFVLILFRDRPDILIPVFTGLGGLIGGFLSGLGFNGRDK